MVLFNHKLASSVCDCYLPKSFGFQLAFYIKHGFDTYISINIYKIYNIESTSNMTGTVERGEYST